MSLVKELVDLVTQLTNSISDRKVREKTLPIQELAIKIQQSQLDFDRKHIEEIQRVQADNLRISTLNSQLIAENTALKAASRPPVDHSVVPRPMLSCPRCHLDALELTDTIHANSIGGPGWSSPRAR